MKTSERKIAKHHIAQLRRRQDYLRAKTVAAGNAAHGHELGELAALDWALPTLKVLALSDRDVRVIVDALDYWDDNYAACQDVAARLCGDSRKMSRTKKTGYA